jgi:tetratricopeptide (TPR) repeat protein
LANCVAMFKCSIIILAAFMMRAEFAYPQKQSAIDSLETALRLQPTNRRSSTLFYLGFEYVSTDIEKALFFCRRAEQAALDDGDTLFLVKSRRLKGQLLYQIERTSEAAETLYDVLPIADRHGLKHEKLSILAILGNVELFMSRYDKALQLFFLALNLANEIGESSESVGIYNGIGLTYYKLKDYERAVGFYIKAMDAAEKFQPDVVFVVSTNIGLCHAYLGDFAAARFYLERSLTACGQKCADEKLVNIEFAFGLISRGEGNDKAAEAHFLRSYALASQSHSSRFQLDNIDQLTELYLEASKYDKAEKLLIAGAQLIAQETPFNLEIIKIYYRFSQLYLSLNQFRKASLYQSRYISLRDSIYSNELTINLMKAEAGFLQRENESKLRAQEQVIVLNDQVIKHQRMLNLLSTVIIFLSAAMVIFFFMNYRKNKALNELLDKKVTERTKELENSRDELVTSLKQQEIKLQRAFAGIGEKLNTLKGLCLVARDELGDPVAAVYLDQIENTSMQIKSYLEVEINREM